MRFKILTIFPEYFTSPLEVGLIKKAREKNLIDIEIYDLRDFALDKHKVVDDEPYGGGEGMVFKPEPLYRALTHIKEKDPDTYVVYLSPQGKLFNQKIAEELSKKKNLLFICGRYEGIDERIREQFIEDEISIGDYVLFGGEVASLVILEAIARLIPGVVGKRDSVDRESFTSGLLKYPCYTRPAEFLGFKVPEVLLSGNHTEIENYRRRISLKITLKRRPELLSQVPLSEKDLAFLRDLLQRQRLYLLLLHYPVYNKRGEVIASAITGLDLHDLARLGRTYGLKGVYIVQPLEDQKKIAEDLVVYWISGKGKNYNPLRSKAMELLKIYLTLDAALQEIKAKEGENPILIGTDAGPKRAYIPPEVVRDLLWKKPVCLVLGSAWGLEDTFLRQCDYFLEPIWGRLDSYNHLSVRSAASILLDRIFKPYLIFKRKM